MFPSHVVRDCALRWGILSYHDTFNITHAHVIELSLTVQDELLEKICIWPAVMFQAIAKDMPIESLDPLRLMGQVFVNKLVQINLLVVRVEELLNSLSRFVKNFIDNSLRGHVLVVHRGPHLQTCFLYLAHAVQETSALHQLRSAKAVRHLVVLGVHRGAPRCLYHVVASDNLVLVLRQRTYQGNIDASGQRIPAATPGAVRSVDTLYPAFVLLLRHRRPQRDQVVVEKPSYFLANARLRSIKLFLRARKGDAKSVKQNFSLAE